MNGERKKKMHNKSTIVVELKDMYTGKPSGRFVTVDVTEQGVFVGVSGYGEKTSTPEAARPIVVEMYDKELQVLVWSDINNEDPTHNISLEDAKENRRRKESAVTPIQK